MSGNGGLLALLAVGDAGEILARRADAALEIAKSGDVHRIAACLLVLGAAVESLRIVIDRDNPGVGGALVDEFMSATSAVTLADLLEEDPNG